MTYWYAISYTVHIWVDMPCLLRYMFTILVLGRNIHINSAIEIVTIENKQALNTGVPRKWRIANVTYNFTCIPKHHESVFTTHSLQDKQVAIP